MKIYFIDICSSTQELLIQSLKNSTMQAPCMIVAKNQTNAKGSRGNQWQSKEGNLHLSFVLDENFLPDDLPNSSVSIYFAYLFYLMLKQNGSKIWLKWPNDLYLEKKVGGVLTTKIKNFFICGIGLNIKFAPKDAQILDINTNANELAIDFCKYLKILPQWKNIFSKYSLEFEKSRAFKVHINDKLISLENAQLQDDGSIIINGERIYLAR